jgi:hypothetical protein
MSVKSGSQRLNSKQQTTPFPSVATSARAITRENRLLATGLKLRAEWAGAAVSNADEV